MKDNTLAKLGGTCSILTGVTIVVTAALYLLLPPEQQDACGCPGKFLVSMAQSATVYIVEEGIFALSSLLAIAAVRAISESVRSAHEGWVLWTSNLAIIGQAVNTIEALHRMVFDPLKAATYVKGDAAVKAALTVPGLYRVYSTHKAGSESASSAYGSWSSVYWRYAAGSGPGYWLSWESAAGSLTCLWCPGRYFRSNGS